MSWADLGRWVREAVAGFADVGWTVLALALDAGAGMGPLGAALWTLGYLAALLLAARLLQGRLNARLRRRPGERVRFLAQEVWFFLPAWLVLPFVALGRLVAALGRWLRGLMRRRGTGGDGSPAAAAAPPPQPYLAASLGPSFLLGGAGTAALFLVTELLGPLLAARYDLPPATPPWQFLLLGGRPELAPYLPLERRAPYLAAFLLVLLWGTVWWWSARLVRLAAWRRLGANLVASRGAGEVLPRWRDVAEVRRLVAPARPYLQWSGTLLAAGAPLAGMGWLALAATPYRVGTSEMALALVLGFAWASHLVLRGAEWTPPDAVDEPKPSRAAAAGWPEVRDDLDRRLQFATPPPLRDPRPIAQLDLRPVPAGDGLLSPLLAELMPAGRPWALTSMQAHELRRLARLGHVFTRPPAAPGELRLGDGGRGAAVADDPPVRQRNRVVLAPEGSGKTTLAMLAVANHALMHTRASLLVVRDAASARALHARIVARVDPSTLRWNLRVRLLGDDMAGDLARGIVPDVVVASLHHLTTNVLDQVDVYGPLLRNLGLIVVDDAESFAGAVEAHAQLAFRRLALACRKLLGIEQLGDEAAPLLLALGTESMHRTGSWSEALCGIDAEVERYDVRPGTAGGSAAAASERQHEIYRLRDFRSPTGERLDPVDLVESCERLGVPWHYRRAVDGQRHRGRGALLLRDEPSFAVADPLDAAVVLVEGAWSGVQRELERLALAGCRFPQGPTALITLVDPDEEMAFTQWDEKLSLAAELAVLPRPVLRPPAARTVASHLAADLTQSWTEVGDLLSTFGHGVAPVLRELAREGLLLSERRTDVHAELHRYEHEVFVRALASAVAPDDDEEDSDAPLPPKVSQVELACEHIVPVLDRTDLAPLAKVDADSAPLAYYPGRVFADARGRWVVMHRASDEGMTRLDEGDHEMPAGALLVEPLLGDDVSSPRRRMQVEVLEDGSGNPEESGSRTADPTGHAFYGPDPVMIGEQPLEVALAKVTVTSQHHATYLLGPVFGEVRQRRLADPQTRSRLGASRLQTVACCLYPNPQGAGEPLLCFAEARLLAAVLRAVLPSMLRGAGESMEVALHLESGRPEPGAALAPREGFFLFDLHHLGNGTARALYRDGIELLLRLARLYLERVLYHDRLRALHDQWPDEPGGGAVAEAGEERREREEAVRHRVLAWLDSRLRPEGGAAALSGALGQYGSDLEEGEGDLIDIGRCWWTRDGSVTDLVWAKHRWRLGRGEEAMVDVGFDRITAADARRLELTGATLEPGSRIHREHLGDPAFALPDGTTWGEPRGVWRVEGEDDEPHVSQPGAGSEATAGFHATAAALAWHGWAALEPLAERLLQRSGGNAADAAGRYALARYVASFVAGIPGLRAETAAPSLPPLRPLVEVLLRRQASTAAKSLLLATLLARLGVRTGLFVSPAEGRVLAAAALPEPLASQATTVLVHRDDEGRFARPEDSTGVAEVQQRGRRAARDVHAHLGAWSAAVGLSEPPPLWADLPVSPGEGSRVHAYVPLETAVLAPPGQAHPQQPQSWLFLPLVAVWHALEPRPEPDDADGADTGDSEP
ncbi:MAG TPA: DEAD/DEAH box helicase [Thermoanaerobaculia bacterium]|nr:DEAD/DEAH box helicase [Thermoanaerobaculia bacterium]